MTLIRRLSILLVLVSILAGCVGPCAGDDTPPPVPAEEPTPPAEERVEAPPRIVPLFPERDVLALVAALSSEDPAVVIAAGAQLEWQELTAAEMERLVPLLWKAYLANPKGPVDWNDLRSYVGSVEVPDLIRSLPDEMDKVEAGFIAGGLHRMMLAEHLPVLAEKLGKIDDSAYRHALLGDLLWIPLEYSDRHRATAARMLLANHAAPAPPDREKAQAGGRVLPPLLVDLLDRWTDDHPPCPEMWLARWVRDERPGRKEVPVLLELLRRTKQKKLRDAAVRALGYLLDEETGLWLEANRSDPFATGALARRGDERALEALRSASRKSSTSLAIFLDVSPAGAGSLLRDRVLGPDEAEAIRTLDLIRELLPAGDYWQDVGWDDRMFRGIVDRALRLRLSGPRLASIGAIVPGCRDRRLAEEATRRLLEDLPSAEFFQDPDVLAFLEVGAQEGLLRFLRKAAVAADEEMRDLACEALLRLGDRESVPLLIEYAKLYGVDEEINSRLAEIGGDAVEKCLREMKDDAALAVYYGLPRSAGWFPIEDAIDEEPIRRLIREGKPVDALLAAYGQDPSAGCIDPGRVQDERIRKYLQDRRDRRIDVAWATQQLMLMGDAEARKEVWTALSAGRYRYVDEAEPHIMTLDHDLETIPHWIDELESNCCRVNVVALIFDDLFGLDLDDFRGSPCVTLAKVARDFWERHRGDLVWSRVAGHFVPDVR